MLGRLRKLFLSQGNEEQPDECRGHGTNAKSAPARLHCEAAKGMPRARHKCLECPGAATKRRSHPTLP
eukprot:6487195-Amphidinium_carterae.1